MKESIYDLCLLYSSSPFDIIRIQTDNILILADNDFAKKEKTAIQTTNK